MIQNKPNSGTPKAHIIVSKSKKKMFVIDINRKRILVVKIRLFKAQNWCQASRNSPVITFTRVSVEPI